MAEYAALQGEHQTRLLKLYVKMKSIQKALEEKQRLDARKESNVPAAMTLLNRVFEQSQEDEYNADRDFEGELEAYRADKLEPAAIAERRLKGDYRTAAQLAALGEDKLDEKEIAARLKDGRILSVNQRNPSFEYWRLLNDHNAKGGDVPRQTLQKFEDERIKLVLRVIRATHVLFSTCNNAGSEVVKLGYSPRIINIDESGQLTVAALANVLTSFDNLKALNLFGDIAQLLPYLPDVITNEFRENGLLSVLALLEEKGYPVFRLSLQYRMAPAIMQWPGQFFYNGLLKNHDTALEDNANRKVARDIAMKEYGITGPTGNGSEYWMIDVVNGVSHTQHNGTSLQNHANADRIATLVDQTLSRGVDPSKIIALTYYTGQLSLVSHKVEELAKGKERSWALSLGYKFSSVDSFQGEENEFVFLDIVVGHQQARMIAPGADAEDSEEDNRGRMWRWMLAKGGSSISDDGRGLFI